MLDARAHKSTLKEAPVGFGGRRIGGRHNERHAHRRLSFIGMKTMTAAPAPDTKIHLRGKEANRILEIISRKEK